MRDLFFSSLNLPKDDFYYKNETYRVLTGHGVLMKADESYKYAATDGLRTCVAFALTNTNDSTTFLVHFYSLAQIQNGLKAMCDTFLAETMAEKDIICIIAGGRDFCDSSVAMVEYLCDYVKTQLLTKINYVKIRLDAPLIAQYDETLSLIINLESGESKISIGSTVRDNLVESTEMEESTESKEDLPFSPIIFTNKIIDKMLEKPSPKK